MISILLLLASLVQAQEVSTGTVNLLDEVRISNLGKDTRDLLSGRYRQTGKPTFANGFCFADGTCQTTAPTASVTVYASTAGIVPSNTTAISASVLAVGVDNSTRTITTTRTSRHQIMPRLHMRASDSGALMKCGWLRDGAFFDGQTEAIGTWAASMSGTPNTTEMGAPIVTRTALAAGTYSYTLSCAVSAGNIQVCSSTTGESTCDIEVREVP